MRNDVHSEANLTASTLPEEANLTMDDAVSYDALVEEPHKEAACHDVATNDILAQDVAAESDKELLLKSISQNSVFRALGDASKLDMYHCTPWGSRANWAASREDWVCLRNTLGPGTPLPQNWYDLLLATLFNQTLEFEFKLTTDLKNENISGLAKAAFSERLGGIPNIYELAFMDAAFRVLLLDRSMYMRSVEDGVSQPDEPHIIEEPEAKLPAEDIQVYLDVCTDWMGPLNRFCSAWAAWPGENTRVSESGRQKAGTTILTDQVSEHQAVLSLLHGYNKAMGQTYIARVQENFAMAALALRAMLLVYTAASFIVKRI